MASQQQQQQQRYRPTTAEIALIRQRYNDTRRIGGRWMAASRVGDLLAEVDALEAEIAALTARLARAQEAGQS